MRIRFTLIIALLCFYTSAIGQVYSDLSKEKDTIVYNQLLPIFGKKVKALGFDLPHSAGIGINYIWQESDIAVSDILVGFNNGDMYNVDDMVVFNSTTSETNGVNLRPDVWLFPFLNVYGIFAQANSTTNVDVSVVIPRINDSDELFSLQTSPEFNTTSVGIGITPTAGFFGGWIALDMNFTWTDVDALDKPVFAFVFDPRIGKTIDLKKPDRNISFWFGGFRLKVNRDTNGNLPISDVLPLEEWDEKVTNGQTKVGEAQVQLDTWWDGLTPIEQKNPVNVAKRVENQAKLNVASRFLNGAENAIDNGENSTIQYNLDKRQENAWNFVVGSQFQFNKNYMVRAEYGFLSARHHVFLGLQYRFAL